MSHCARAGKASCRAGQILTLGTREREAKEESKFRARSAAVLGQPRGLSCKCFLLNHFSDTAATKVKMCSQLHWGSGRWAEGEYRGQNTFVFFLTPIFFPEVIFFLILLCPRACTCGSTWGKVLTAAQGDI